MYLRIRYKIHVFGFMSQHLCISRMLCKIHVNVSGFMSQHLYISGSSARSMSPDPCLRFRSQHPYVSQEPLQDPCLLIRIEASIYISGSSARSMSPIHVSASLYLRVLCKIHVFGFMSQHLYISGSSARSMSPYPYISIHVYLKLLCNIHVSGSVHQHPYVSQDPLQEPCLRIRI